MIDLGQITWRRDRNSYELQYPNCGHWVRELLILTGYKLSCRMCQKDLPGKPGVSDGSKKRADVNV